MEPKQRFVVGFLVNGLEEVLLIKKTKPAWQLGRLNGVGGKVEFGETFEQAMSREFFEETNIRVPIEDWTFKIDMVGPDYHVGFFLAYGDNYGFKQMTEETLHLVRINNLPPETIYNLRWMLPLCLDSSVACPVQIIDVKPHAECSANA